MRVQKLLELLVKELYAPLGFPVRIGENGLPLHLGGIDDLVSLGLGLGNNVLGVALLLPEAIQILRGCLVAASKMPFSFRAASASEPEVVMAISRRSSSFWAADSSSSTRLSLLPCAISICKSSARFNFLSSFSVTVVPPFPCFRDVPGKRTPFDAINAHAPIYE